MLSLKDLVSQVKDRVAGEGPEVQEALPSGDDSQPPVPPTPIEPEPTPGVDIQAIVNTAVAAAIAPLKAQIAMLEASRAKDEAIARATLNVHARDIVSVAAKEHLIPKLDQIMILLGKEDQRDDLETRRLAVLERVEPLLTALYNLGARDMKALVEEMQRLDREAKAASASANAHATDAVNAVNALGPYLSRILKEEIPTVARKGGGTDEEF